MVAEPTATPATVAVAFVVVAATTTLGVTVAKLVLLELRLTGRPPAGAGAERVTVIVRTPPTPSEIAVGDKAIAASTLAVSVSPV